MLSNRVECLFTHLDDRLRCTCFLSSFFVIGFHGKKPGNTTACCEEEWQAGFGGQQPHNGLFLGGCTITCCGFFNLGDHTDPLEEKSVRR
jgi:hypothetical protein